MSKLTRKELVEIIQDLDIAMLTTQTATGALESRPMSNNRDVEYDGHSYFFAEGDSEVVAAIKRNPSVNLAMEGRHAMFTKKIYLSIAGKAEVTTDKAAIRKHWVPDLEAWFKDGVDTPGLTLIHVAADTVRYWDGMEQGEVAFAGASKSAA